MKRQNHCHAKIEEHEWADQWVIIGSAMVFEPWFGS